nr:thioredoxin domain-containing protein [Desulfobacula sp.]
MTGGIEKLKQEYGVQIQWRAFPLNPDTPLEGLPLAELFKQKGIAVDVDKMMTQLKTTAAGFGLFLGDRKMTYNSRLAQETGLWAETKGRGHSFHMEAFTAYFAEGRNIAQKEVLLDLVKKSGLDPEEGETVIDGRSFSGAVDADWERSRNLGITAVPTFLMGLDRLVGAKPYATLKGLVEKYTKGLPT